MKKINTKKLKFKVNNSIVVVFAIVLVMLLNIVTVLTETKFPKLKIDLTENSVTKISNETREVLKSVDEKGKEIELIYLTGTADIKERVSGILEQYDAYSECVTYKSVNYHTNPAFLSSYGINSEANVDGSVLVATKDKSKARIVAASDMEISYNNNTVFLLENLLTNAIGVVASDRQMTVCFTTGHGEIIQNVQTNPVTGVEEQGGIMLINLIKSENIAAYQYDISTGEIPKEIDLVMIMSPKTDFTQKEIDTLDDYMLNGGNVAVALTSEIKLDRLESYLETWGIKVNGDIVTETDAQSRFDESGVYFYAHKTDSEILADVESRIMVSYAKSLEFTPTGDIEAEAILTSSNAAQSMTINGEEVSAGIKRGLFNIGYVLEKPLNESFENTAKMIVTSTESAWGITCDTVTNYDALIYYSLSEQSLGNADFVMNMLSYVFGETIQSIYVPVKAQNVSMLTMTDTEANIASRILGIAVPFVIVLSGVIVWLKRRNK